jgi:UDP-N-acetylmuramyl pentapeptide phosphotransferase/UDP-N-acetylglucosamine-1-phosphate transferase
MIQKNQNRSFGLLFFFVFLALSLWPLTNKDEVNLYLILIAIIFLILGLKDSKILSPLNKAWIKLGEILGRIIAPIVMALIYFLILTPISLLVRLFGKDLIGMKFRNDIKSYWVKRKKHLGSMDKQF